MTNVKRILHIVGGMNRGGAETFIMNMYRKLDREKFQFDFVVHTETACDYDDEIIALGGRIFVRKRARLTGYRFAHELSKTIIEHGPFHAIHSHVHFFSGITLRVACQTKIPIRIAHSHTDNDGQSNSVLRNMYRGLMRRWIHRYGTDLLGCSAKACKALYSASADHSKVIQNGIDLSIYEQLFNSAKDEQINKLKHSQKIVHVGRFAEVKNHLFLLEIFCDLLKRLPNVTLVLVGDGPLLGKVKERARELNIQESVQFLGVRNDVPKILSEAAVMIMPSLYEGIPLVVIEAQAAGLPIIVSERISKDVDVGLGLVHTISLDRPHTDWVQKLVELVEHKPVLSWKQIYESMWSKGYSVDRVVAEMRKIYD